MRKSFASVYTKLFVMPSESPFFNKREYIATENTDFEGRAIQASVVKIDSPADRYKGLSADDFCLENQLSVGVELKPVKCSLVNSSELDNQIK